MATFNVRAVPKSSREGTGGALPALADDAQDMKRIMSLLAEQISDADRRHRQLLEAMQQRLGALGENTSELREQLPDEASGVLDRIEGSMAQLSDRVATTRAAAASDASPSLRSALALEALDIYARTAGTPRSEAHAEIDTFDVVDSSTIPGAADDFVDREIADALAQHYGPAAANPSADSAATAEAPAKAEPAVEAAAKPAEALDGQRKWLETQLADVAKRVEQSIASLNRGNALDEIEQRFTVLEDKLTEAMGSAVQKVDLAGLKSIEAQVDDLSQQFAGVQSQFGRLDTIEMELRGLAERMSVDELGKLFGNKKPTAADAELVSQAVASRVEQQMPKFEAALHSFATQLSADKIARLVADAKPPAPDLGAIAKMVADQVSLKLPSPMPTPSDPTARLDGLKSSIEALAAQQRHGDEQTTAMLDTMQQAMIRLLDRMEAIEQSRFVEQVEPAADIQGYEDLYRDPPEELRRPDHQLAVAQTIKPASMQERQAVEYDQLPHAPQSLAQDKPAVAQADPSSEKRAPSHALSATALRANFQQTTAEESAPAAAGANREDFIAAARRAARKAAEAPPELAASAEESDAQTKPAARSKKKAAGGLSALSMALIFIMVVGVSFIAVMRLTIFAPSSSPQPGPQSQAPGPAVSPERSSADKRIQNLEDVDAVNGQQSPAQRRSSLQGRGGGADRDLIGQEAFPPAGPGGASQDAGIPTLPAALTKDTTTATPARGNEMPPLAIGPNSLRTAAAKGDASAEFEVGARFAEGRGVQQDLQQAITWLTRSASQGFAQAQYRLGSMYERGLGTKTDLARARVWYQRAAEQGIVKAMHNLAVLSAGRDTAVTDYQAAGKWFRAAADHGLTDSQFNLAIMHDSGLGMERDAKQAYKWFSIAARAGDEEASRRREALRQKLLPQEISEVEAEVAAWRPKTIEQNVNDPRLAGETWKNRAR